MNDVPPGDPMPPMPTSPEPGATVEPPIPETPVDEAPRRRRRWPVVVGVVVLVLIAGAAFAAWRLAGTGDVLLETAPAGSEIVVTAYLDPAASQKLNLLRMVQQFPDVGSEDEIRQQVDEWLDEALGEVGLSHTDLEWVGSQALIWVDLPEEGDPRIAFVLSADDADAARGAADRMRTEMSSGGQSVTETTYADEMIWSTDDAAWAVTGDLMIFASEPEAVETTIDTAAGTSEDVTTDEGFIAATDPLPDESLGMMYIALDDTLAAFERFMGTTQPLGQQGDVATDIAMSVSATPTGLEMDTITRYDPDADPALLDELTSTQENLALGAVPSDSVMTLAFTGIAAGLNESVTAFEEADPLLADEMAELGLTGAGGFLESLRGDLGMGVIPADGDVPVGAVVAFGVDDETALDTFAGRLIDAFEESLQGSCPSKRCPQVNVLVGTVEHDGATISFLGDLPVPVAWTALDGVAIIGSSPDDVSAALDSMSAGDGISTTDRYQQATALVGGDQQFMMIDVAAALALVRDAVPPEELAEFEEEGAPYLEPIDMVVFGGTGDRTMRHDRFVIAIPGSE